MKELKIGIIKSNIRKTVLYNINEEVKIKILFMKHNVRSKTRMIESILWRKIR
jgi:hypothetical protein